MNQFVRLLQPLPSFLPPPLPPLTHVLMVFFTNLTRGRMRQAAEARDRHSRSQRGGRRRSDVGGWDIIGGEGFRRGAPGVHPHLQDVAEIHGDAEGEQCA